MSSTVVVFVGLAVGVYALKAVAPVLLGARPLPGPLTRASTLLPAALLAALVVTSGFASGRSLAADGRVVGIAAAVVALMLRAPFVVVVLGAAAATAAARALG